MVQPNDEVDLIEREREDGQKVRSVRVWSPSCVGWADWQHVQMPPTVHAHPFPLSSFWGINCRLNRPFRKFNFDHNLSHSHPFLSLSPFECSKLTYPSILCMVRNTCIFGVQVSREEHSIYITKSTSHDNIN